LIVHRPDVIAAPSSTPSSELFVWKKAARQFRMTKLAAAIPRRLARAK
jgi:hypothetical protein